nr:reverse transcriptase domain-containing protein [Tanacetum cinerariifolium]
MADQRTMAQLLQAPTEGYEDAIVVPAITADNFELKHGLLTLVQNKQFFRHEKEDPYAHVCYFNKITSTLKFPNVLNMSIKLMLFPFSLEGAAWIWLEKEPSRSIFTWDDLVSKFINQFFPPSKTTNLRNEITHFQQRFDESFSEAWDRFKDLIRACPHHGFSELHQLDTFYNALNSKDQDSLNSAASGDFLDKMPRKCLDILESKSKVCYSRNKLVITKVSTNTSTSGISPDVVELKDIVKALLLDKKNQNQSPSPMKAVEESCVTYSGAHSYCNCPAIDGNVYRENIQEFVSQAFAVNYNQGNTSYRPLMMSNQSQLLGPVYQALVFQPLAYQSPAYQASAPQTQGVSKKDFSAYVKANDVVMRNIQTQGHNMQNQLTDLITKFVKSNSTSTSSLGTLPCNTIANTRSDLKAITTRSGMSYDGPSTSFLPKVVENEVEVTKDTVNPTNNGSTDDVQPQVVQSESLILTSEPVTSPISEPVLLQLSLLDLTPTCMNLKLADRLISRPVGVAEDVYIKVGSFHFSADFVVIDFDADPRAPLILGRLFLKTRRALIDVFEAVELKDLPPHLEYAFLEGDDKLPIIIAKDLSMEEKTALITVMQKYGVTHRLATPYHPQTSGQVEVSNRDLKRILERAVGENRASWSNKLDDALWVFRTAYKTPIECTLYKLVYGKACHLPVELEHKAYWAFKHANFDLKTAGDHRKVQINELCDQAYENSLVYKEKTKRLHDSKIKNRVFNIGNRVFLFNFRLKIFSRKLKSRWSGPFTISQFYLYATVELS